MHTYIFNPDIIDHGSVIRSGIYGAPISIFREVNDSGDDNIGGITVIGLNISYPSGASGAGDYVLYTKDRWFDKTVIPDETGVADISFYDPGDMYSTYTRMWINNAINVSYIDSNASSTTEGFYPALSGFLYF